MGWKGKTAHTCTGKTPRRRSAILAAAALKMGRFFFILQE
jgi:hypothetical protein